MTNINDLSAKLQQLQNQVAQFNQMQAQAQTPQSAAPAATSYPKVVRTDTVEDILSNPQWRQELESEFTGSDFGKKAKNYTDVLFMEFCENQTGKPSAMLEGLRREAKAKDKEASKNGQTGKKDSKAGGTDAGEDA